MQTYTFWDLNPCRAEFESHVKMGPSCWLWRGPRKNQFGSFRFLPAGDRKTVATHAHRVATFFLGDGRLPAAGEDVRHLCPDTMCVRPDHLEFVEVDRDVLEIVPEILEPLRGRFLSYVALGGDCWPWTGCVRNQDVPASPGCFRVGGAKYAAPRLAMYFFAGRVILPGEDVRHLCRDPRCVRPEHLRVEKC